MATARAQIALNLGHGYATELGLEANRACITKFTTDSAFHLLLRQAGLADVGTP